MYQMLAWLETIFIFAVILAIPIVWLCSLVLYLVGRAKNNKVPNTVPPHKMERRLIFLIVSSVIFGIVIVGTVSLIALLAMALTYM